ncbi:MAG: O-antigen ligase family protein [Elusimicrobiales bacterium]|nr:O-antigen ligase family protein [Elusimicrobiales bacterium]
MSKKTNLPASEFDDISFAPGVSFARKAIWWWLPVLYLLISDTFYLRTYDSAQVKITLLQMGGFGLLGLWASLLVLEGRRAFRREDFVFLAPFFAYLVYVIVSFLSAPYRGPSVDDFVRYLLYMSVTLIIIREFTASAVDRLTKVLLITAYIAIGYGVVQFLDTRFFPPKDAGPGLDPFVWRWAFGPRVFSTYGNPNFFGNFLVLILPIIVTQWMKRKSVFLLPLIGMNLLCLYATETKGAFLGFGISAFLFSVFYGYFFLREKLRISKSAFVALASIIPAAAFLIIYLLGNPLSYSFRINTWLSTWEMIETHPLVGVGVGSFKVIYPAFRRPEIFHIEGKHNTETDHAEDEHLEQWMDNGLIGFGLYLWIIFFVTTVGLRALGSLTANLKGARPPPVAYDLLGYLTALLGMLAHNFTDVSMRFVSSGVYLGLLPGVIIVLARGHALWELHYKEESQEAKDEAANPAGKDGFYPMLVWVARAAGVAGVLYAAWLVLSEFAGLQGPLRNYIAGGEILQWHISWALMLLCVGYAVYSFCGVMLKGVSAAVPVVVLLTLFPIYYFWGWFKGDVYHNMAIFFSKQGKWEDAIGYYKRVNKLNQFFIMPYYFTGNVFNDRFNMERAYRPEWGDTNNQPRDDFERAMEAYEYVRSIAPNYVQMHHQVGTLYMKMHDHLARQGKQKEAQEYLDMALARYNLYENLDPVYQPNYYRKAQVYIMRNDLKSAEREYKNNVEAWKCYKKDHNHGSPEGYTLLANVQYALNKFPEAARNYRLALEKDPNYEQARRNLQVVYSRFPELAKAAEKEKASLVTVTGIETR